MTKSEALEECQRWLDYLEHQRNRVIEMQKLATMARQGKQEEAQKRMRQMDRQPKVYDGARLEQAVKVLMREVTK